MRSKFLITILVAGLLLGSFAAGNYASGQSKSKGYWWEYTLLKHSPYLREAGSDFKEFQEMGKDGWELSSSYPVKGEIVNSVFKRKIKGDTKPRAFRPCTASLKTSLEYAPRGGG